MTPTAIFAEYMAREEAAKRTPQGFDVDAICAAIAADAGLPLQEVRRAVADGTITHGAG